MQGFGFWICHLGCRIEASPLEWVRNSYPEPRPTEFSLQSNPQSTWREELVAALNQLEPRNHDLARALLRGYLRMKIRREAEG